MEAALSTGRWLHLFANFKWTGPADPAIRGAVALRRAGLDLRFAQVQWTLPGAEHRMRKELWRARLPVTGDLELRKHFQLRSHRRDARRLRERLDRGDFDGLHCHLPADHLIAAWAKCGARRSVPLVRSLYEPEAPGWGWRSGLAFRYTDGVVVPTRSCQRQVCERYGFEPERVLYQDPPTDTRRAALAGDLRDQLGVGAGQVLIGITARIQPHRRFELLWQVARRVVDRCPRARFVLLGRGNAADTERLVHRPIRELGLTEQVLTPGYLYEPDYSLALRSLDLFTFLVPGSDGTCRAVREVMALGIPVVATPRGILPELLGEHPDLASLGPSGEIVAESAELLAAAIVSLIADPERRQRRGAAGRARVAGPMDSDGASRRLIEFYGWLREHPRRPSR